MGGCDLLRSVFSGFKLLTFCWQFSGIENQTFLLVIFLVNLSSTSHSSVI